MTGLQKFKFIAGLLAVLIAGYVILRIVGERLDPDFAAHQAAMNGGPKVEVKRSSLPGSFSPLASPAAQPAIQALPDRQPEPPPERKKPRLRMTGPDGRPMP